MANTIKLAQSNTGGYTPDTLAAGEVAINTYNQKIWVGNGSGNTLVFNHANYALASGNATQAWVNSQGFLTSETGDIQGVTAGAGLSGGGTSGTPTLSHADTSSQASSDNSGKTFIQDVTLDTYGHVTGLGTSSWYIPTATSGAVGGVEIGYTENGKNYPVELYDKKMFVNVPWTDTNTDTNYYLNGLSWNSGSGILTASVSGTSSRTVDLDGRYLNLTAGTLYSGGNDTTLVVKCNNAGRAMVQLGKSHDGSQGTGVLELTQDGSYGGGLSYNGDNSPTFATGETADYMTFYRMNNGSRDEVFSYPYNSNTVTFNGALHWSGGNSNNANTAYGWGNHASAGYSTTDTNTTYSAGVGLNLSGTTFTLNGAGIAGGNLSWNGSQLSASIGVSNVGAGNGLTGGGGSSTSTVHVGAGSGITVNSNDVAHSDTSSQSSVNGSGRTYIQDVTLDGFGHVTGLATATETVTNSNTTYSAGTGISLSGTTFSIGSAWANMPAGVRTNYTLGIRAPSSGYAGFYFQGDTGGNAGYLLVRGASGSDVYTTQGITLVADLGWLSLAQRSTSGKGVRIMSGTTSTERLKITTAGDIQFVNGNSFTYNGNNVATQSWVNSQNFSTTTGDITNVSAGGGLTGGGSSGSVTISHADTSGSNSSSNSGRTYLQSATLDTYGHVTSLSTATETVTNTNTTYSAGTGLTLSGTTFSCNSNVLQKSYYWDINSWLDFGSSNGAGLYWSSGTGSSWHIYPVNSHGMRIRAGSTASGYLLFQTTSTNRGYLHWNNSNKIWIENNAGSERLGIPSSGSLIRDNSYVIWDQGNVSGGGGITVSGNVISHSDTSSQASINGSGREYIQDITLDTYGHVTGLSAASETVTNTNTTYSAGTGMSLSGTTFNSTCLLKTGGTMSGNTVASDFGIGNVGLYHASKYQAVWSMGTSYLLPSNGANTGSLYGLAWSHTNAGGQTKSGLSHQLLLCMNGTTKTALGSGIWTDGTITTTGHGTSANWNTAYGWGNHASAGYTSNTGDITNVSAGGGLTGGGSSGSVTVSHSDTSSQGSVNNSGNTVIQDVSLDGYGHVTSLTSATISGGGGGGVDINGLTSWTSPGIYDEVAVDNNGTAKQVDIRYLPVARSSTFSSTGSCAGYLYMHNGAGSQQDSTYISLYGCSSGGS